jgi:hypothetical protein
MTGLDWIAAGSVGGAQCHIDEVQLAHSSFTCKPSLLMRERQDVLDFHVDARTRDGSRRQDSAAHWRGSGRSPAPSRRRDRRQRVRSSRPDRQRFAKLSVSRARIGDGAAAPGR